ncbi:CLUMA_CG003881, isoform A [Clunio marinus]|uniref:CLUMA_CG003881, isoform A n=1 Tax=Clunio marinus TaxID=568069 RepID=A0A1J1HUI7_9DIPT|nr:CLUMA_CG003881, isoform A [Clunio marinus]
MNLKVDLIRKVYKFSIEYDLSVKHQNRFRSLSNAKDLEVCTFLNGTLRKHNTILKWMFSIVEPMTPKGFFHPCPYYGIVEMNNIVPAFSSNSLKLFLVGTYKIKVKLYNADDDNIATIRATGEANNIKD